MKAYFLIALVLSGSGGPVHAQLDNGFQLGLNAGLAAVRTQRSIENSEFGPMIGGHVRWGGNRSSIGLSIDVQPFRADIPPDDGLRAAYLLPTWTLRLGTGGVGAGIGAAILRFDNESGVEGRTDVVLATGANGSVRLSRSWAAEVGWRSITSRTRGIRPTTLFLQLVRYWRF
jgi:hypothetical protein